MNVIGLYEEHSFLPQHQIFLQLWNIITHILNFYLHMGKYNHGPVVQNIVSLTNSLVKDPWYAEDSVN